MGSLFFPKLADWEQLTLLDDEGHPFLFASIMIATLSTCAQLERDNEVVWTFMKFKICLYFWGVLGPWRGSIASYTTDERAKNGQKERWRLNLEEIKLQIKSSSEKFRRLQYLIPIAVRTETVYRERWKTRTQGRLCKNGRTDANRI